MRSLREGIVRTSVETGASWMGKHVCWLIDGREVVELVVAVVVAAADKGELVGTW